MRRPTAKGAVQADVPRAFFTCFEFAASAGMAVDSVYRMIRAGRLAAVRMGAGEGEWRIPASEIERLTDEAFARVEAVAS